MYHRIVNPLVIPKSYIGGNKVTGESSNALKELHFPAGSNTVNETLLRFYQNLQSLRTNLAAFSTNCLLHPITLLWCQSLDLFLTLGTLR